MAINNRLDIGENRISDAKDKILNQYKNIEEKNKGMEGEKRQWTQKIDYKGSTGK